MKNNMDTSLTRDYKLSKIKRDIMQRRSWDEQHTDTPHDISYTTHTIIWCMFYSACVYMQSDGFFLIIFYTKQ